MTSKDLIDVLHQYHSLQKEEQEKIHKLSLDNEDVDILLTEIDNGLESQLELERLKSAWKNQLEKDSWVIPVVQVEEPKPYIEIPYCQREREVKESHIVLDDNTVNWVSTPSQKESKPDFGRQYILVDYRFRISWIPFHRIKDCSLVRILKNGKFRRDNCTD